MRRLWLAAVATIALAPGARASAAPASVRPLIDRMTKTGRAEARVVLTVSSAGDSASSRPAALALEPKGEVGGHQARGAPLVQRRAIEGMPARRLVRRAQVQPMRAAGQQRRREERRRPSLRRVAHAPFGVAPLVSENTASATSVAVRPSVGTLNSATVS